MAFLGDAIMLASSSQWKSTYEIAVVVRTLSEWLLGSDTGLPVEGNWPPEEF